MGQRTKSWWKEITKVSILGCRHDVVGEELVAGGLPALPHLLLGLLLWGGVWGRLHPQVRSCGCFLTTGTTIMITMMIMMILHGLLLWSGVWGRLHPQVRIWHKRWDPLIGRCWLTLHCWDNYATNITAHTGGCSCNIVSLTRLNSWIVQLDLWKWV